MRELFELIHTYSDEATGVAVFLLLVVWYVCNTIKDIYNKKYGNNNQDDQNAGGFIRMAFRTRK